MRPPAAPAPPATSPGAAPPQGPFAPEAAHLAAARRILEAGALCDHCLGRCFGKVGTGTTNDARGRALREALGPDAPRAAAAAVPPADCTVCEGLFGELDHLAAVAVEALRGWEFETFLIGSRLDPDVAQAEQERWALAREAAGVAADGTSEADAWPEPVASEVNREVGKRVAEAVAKEANPGRPDIAAVVDARYDLVELQVAPVFLYARYGKFVRDIPQTRWPCTHCRGRGCTACGLTGRQYGTSVQELVQAEAVKAFGARDADFHGMGREDIDARCLGTGRPFVLELKEPRKRLGSVDLAALEHAINAHARPRAEVEGLRASERAEVARVKAADSEKEYRAEVAFEAPVAEANVYKAVEGLRGATVAQRTPSRVQHRRAALTRSRAVHAIEVERAGSRDATLRIRGQAGLYIKELVSGDGGRTRPSLTELLGVRARVTALDVVAVADADAAPAPAPSARAGEPPPEAPPGPPPRAGPHSQSSASR